MTIRHALPAMMVLAVLSGCASTAGSAAQHSFANHTLISRASPAIALRVDPAFRALPAFSFTIEALTDVERRVFVDVDADHVVRRSDFRFRYPSRPPRQYGAETYRFGAYVYDDAREAAAAPDREAARTRAQLVAQGLAPPRLWRTSRLARVTDADGLSEIIIFYNENADADYPVGPLANADEDGDVELTPEQAEALARRMEATIQPVSG